MLIIRNNNWQKVIGLLGMSAIPPLAKFWFSLPCTKSDGSPDIFRSSWYWTFFDNHAVWLLWRKEVVFQILKFGNSELEHYLITIKLPGNCNSVHWLWPKREQTHHEHQYITKSTRASFLNLCFRDAQCILSCINIWRWTYTVALFFFSE